MRVADEHWLGTIDWRSRGAAVCGHVFEVRPPWGKRYRWLEARGCVDSAPARVSSGIASGNETNQVRNLLTSLPTVVWYFNPADGRLVTGFAAIYPDAGSPVKDALTFP